MSRLRTLGLLLGGTGIVGLGCASVLSNHIENAEQYLLRGHPQLDMLKYARMHAVHENPPIINQQQREEIVRNDLLLYGLSSELHESVFPSKENAENSEDEPNGNRKRLVLVSGPPGCGRADVIKAGLGSREEETEDDPPMFLSINMEDDLLESVRKNLSEGIINASGYRFYSYPFTRIAEYIIGSSSWQAKNLATETQALDLLEKAANLDQCKVLVVDEYSKKHAKIVPWLYRLVLENTCSVVLNSFDQAFAPEELNKAVIVDSRDEVVDFVNIVVSDPRIDGEGTEEVVQSRLRSVFKDLDCSLEDMLEIVKPMTGLRFEDLLLIARHRPSDLQQLQTAANAVKQEQMELLKRRLRFGGHGSDVSHLLDVMETDLSIWTWGILENLSGMSIQLGGLDELAGHAQGSRKSILERSMPGLPISITENGLVRFTESEIPYLSLHCLEVHGIPATWRHFPRMDEDSHDPILKMVSASPLTLEAFKELHQDSEFLEAVSKRREEVHRKEDLIHLFHDLEDYLERRASFERSVRYFEEHVQELGDVMSEEDIIKGRLDIAAAERSLETERRELESRKKHLLFFEDK